jgi:hypothetical protein
VRIKDPPANLMASFKFTWVGVADGAGDFRRFTIDAMKLKTLTASFHSELDEFIDNLDDLLTYGSARKIGE